MSRFLRALPILLLWIPWPDVAASQTPGLDARPANPTCVAGARPATGQTVHVGFEPLFDMGLVRPTSVRQSPVDPSVWYVSELGVDWRPDEIGLVRKLTWTPGGGPATSEVFLDISDRVVVGNSAGILGMAFHPGFESNGEVFVSYTGHPSNPGELNPFTSYVSRFTSSDGGATLDPASEEILVSRLQPHFQHNAGDIEFGPTDGFLYVSMGDGGIRTQGRSQDNDDLLGAILRLDVDGGSPYGIPPDNPFAQGGGAPEIFAWGLRNPWRIGFDSLTGDLFAGDVGWNTWEEINHVPLGANLGWPIFEGNDCIEPPCSLPDHLPPLVPHLHADVGGDAQSIAGGVVYRGSAIPALVGRYVYGDINGSIWALPTDALSGNAVPKLIATASGNPIGFEEDAAGEILVVLLNGVHRLVEVPPPPDDPFPETLSETGCFDPGDPTIPAAGLIPFDVASPLWSDDAGKERWMALPDGETITIEDDGDWTFPIGTVLVKSFWLGSQRIETRLLMRHADGGWAGYSYEWDEDETEADLLPDGKDRVVGSQTWHYPSRGQCMVCHTGVAGRTLAPRTEQLNVDAFYPSTGRTANQLLTLDHIGMFATPLEDPPASLPRLADPADDGEPLEDRARSYLDSNCSHCHRPGGSTPTDIDFRASVLPWEMNVCDRIPQVDDLGIPGARLVTPGDPASSIVSVRLHAQNADRMPPLGVSIVDPLGTGVVDGWIAAMSECAFPDEDGDGVSDFVDNCLGVSNPDQTDVDGDGIGNLCDAECSDAQDNDGDGWVDHPDDPGCADGDDRYEAPACQDGIDNDDDGLIDFDGGLSILGPGHPDLAEPDGACAESWGGREQSRCAVGPELLLLAPLLRLRRRRRAQAAG